MSNVYQSPAAPGLIEGGHTHRHVSWSALFAGVVLTVAIELLLSLLGAGIGLGTINVNAGSTPSASSFGIGAALWWVISSCVALFAGGFVAAWLAGNETRVDGILHGLVTWAIATLLTIYLLTSAVGGIIGGGFAAIGSAVSTVGRNVKDAAAPVANSLGVSHDMIKRQANAYLQPAAADPAKMSAQDAQKDVASNLVTYQQGGQDAQAAKQRIIDVSAAQLKISRDEATKKFDDTQAKIDQGVADAKQKAKEAADASASAASRTAFAIFVNLLLGALAGALGGASVIGSSFGRRWTHARA